MTHRERVLRTFRFEATDRVAFDLMEGHVWPELMAYFRSEHGLVDREHVLDSLDTDFRWTGMIHEPANPDEKKEDPPSARAIQTREVARGPLAEARTAAEVDSYDWPDPNEWCAGDFTEAARRWPDHAQVFVPGWDPLFWGTCEVFGVEAALVNLVSSPALFECAVRNIHERYMDRLARGLEAARGLCDICWLGDDFASQESLFLSPDHWRRCIKPCLAEQVELARSEGMYVLYHSCGAVRPVLGDLIDIGVNGLDVFQTRAKGMDVESIAAEFGGRLAFYGGIDVQHLLCFATPEEVAAEVRRNVRAFAGCGGYVVANSHHCVATIQGDNVVAMCRAAREAKRNM